MSALFSQSTGPALLPRPNHILPDDGRNKSSIDGFLVPASQSDMYTNTIIINDEPIKTYDHRLVLTTRCISAAGVPPRSLKRSENKPLKRLKIKWQLASKNEILEQYSRPMEKSALNIFKEATDVLRIDTATAENLLLQLKQCMIKFSLKLPHSFPSRKNNGKPEWSPKLQRATMHKPPGKHGREAVAKNLEPCTSTMSQRKKNFRSCQCQARAIQKNCHLKEIEVASESNQALFFRMIKRSSGYSNKEGETSSLIYAGNTYADGDVLTGRHDYFADLAKDTALMPSPIRNDDIQPPTQTSNSCSSNDADPSHKKGWQLTSRDLNRAIDGLKKGKASGPDNITAEHIKNLQSCARRLLLLVLNAIILNQPHQPLKEGIILPSTKEKAKLSRTLKNYRGNTLTSVMSKLLELSIKPRLEQQLLTQNIPDELQFGFRRGFTSLSLQLSIEINTASKKTTAFLDAEKAFDIVWHQGLLDKLRDAHIDQRTLNLIQDMYHGMTSRVYWQERVTPPIQGVRQDGVLSPTVYITFVNGLIDELRQRDLGSTLQNRYSGVIVLADDVALLSTSSNRAPGNANGDSILC